MYGQVENGKVVKVFSSKPQWYYDDGSIISNEDLLKENIYPIDTLFTSFIDFNKERLVVNDLENLIIDYKNKKIINYFKLVKLTLDEVYELKHQDIESTKRLKLFVDLKYNFPNNRFGHIQLRNEQDINNIHALYSDSMHSITNNIEKDFYFKDKSNFSHKLTPTQMSDLCSTVQSHIDNVNQEYWKVKHEKLDTIFNDSFKDESQRIDEIISIIWK